MAKHQKKLLQEIQDTAGPKMFNVQRGTASKREVQIVKECQAYLCLLNHSVLTPKQVYLLWQKSGLVYQ
jgi:hypothetical protein